MPHVEAVAGAGGVEVVGAIVGDQAVIGGVVDALEAQARAQVVALGGVVVHDVEDDLDAGLVQPAHHGLELGDLGAEPRAARVLVVRGEEADGVVAPVVAQALVDQVAVVDELVDRHELERRDAQALEVLDDAVFGQCGVRAAALGRNARVPHGQAAHVRLVDDGLVQRRVRPVIATPVEGHVGHHRARHERRAVVVVALARIAVHVVEARRVPAHLPLDRLGVGIEQQLVGVAALALGGIPRAVDPEAVAGACAQAGHVAVPAVGVDLA